MRYSTKHLKWIQYISKINHETKIDSTTSQTERTKPQKSRDRTYHLILEQNLPTTTLYWSYREIFRHTKHLSEWTQTRRKESNWGSQLKKPPIQCPNRIPLSRHLILIVSKINLLISSSISVSSSLVILVVNFIFHCYCYCVQPISGNKPSRPQAQTQTSVSG